MPGCERLEEVGAGQFDLTFGVPVPAIKGSYSGTVRILDQEPPSSFRMTVDAKGKNGFILADARMRLEDNGTGSVVHYEADAQVGGPAASVGQRVLVGISRRQIQQMMICIDSAEGQRAGLVARILAWITSKLRFGRQVQRG